MNTDMNADICNDSEFDSHASSSSSSSCRTEMGTKGSAGNVVGITCLGDTYAIEIKPKQGWLQLPSDVSDLFDLMPAGAAETMDMDASCNPRQEQGQQGLTLTPDKCRCRYCSMQLLKVSVSVYLTLLLFDLQTFSPLFFFCPPLS